MNPTPYYRIHSHLPSIVMFHTLEQIKEEPSKQGQVDSHLDRLHLHHLIHSLKQREMLGDLPSASLAETVTSTLTLLMRNPLQE